MLYIILFNKQVDNILFILFYWWKKPIYLEQSVYSLRTRQEEHGSGNFLYRKRRRQIVYIGLFIYATSKYLHYRFIYHLVQYV